MIGSGFYKITLPEEKNSFIDLFHSADFELVAKGRIGNHLVNKNDNGIPIVRTTTKYKIPANNFSAIHHQMIININDAIKQENLSSIPPLYFNNALIEVYDSHYSKMNYHSDQSMDLEENSYIGLYSCYERPEELTERSLRMLMVKDKITNEEFKISLTHNSVVLFSLETNTRFHHKIILESLPTQKPLEADNRWLGITFRKSKTHIQFNDGLPHFSNGELLTLATQEQEAEFYKLRGQENRAMDFSYPHLTYTLSTADTILPKNCGGFIQ